MKHQIFIASYHKDFPWLEYCLRSLTKFAVGWLPPVVCVSSSDEAGANMIASYTCPEAIVVVKDGRPSQGFMRAQLGMMQADLYCPDADVIYFLGSDCLAFREFRPENYCDRQGRPAVLYTDIATMRAHVKEALPWVEGTERVLGFDLPAEYMRRLPSVYPRSIFKPMRDYVERVHGEGFEDYIYRTDAIHHNTSEANILGAFAHRFMPETCCWVNTHDPLRVEATSEGWPIATMQLWSHGGLDKPMQFPETGNYVLPDGTHTHGLTPRFVAEKILG